ncbi:uncharacterized protein TRAVEDRAFT_54547 [Trametes versicolor FP-101664 SS1]|uniref:Uncharacterized protein n=1 Tax=Trametes versicolor (strain FP-101664) TaxID=717944 RepID=R7S785_TRAVS|nr:uncharacterized protein TRAVEDRAFT_54547 [Trametes versicolor FP-101664 SS1]EIW51457.1 hypothetical protein TRAVEDRAFT_54547 [Trametes versicolor FP-101664 SS1]
MSSLRPLCLLVSLDSLRLPLPVSAAFLHCDRGESAFLQVRARALTSAPSQAVLPLVHLLHACSFKSAEHVLRARKGWSTSLLHVPDSHTTVSFLAVPGPHLDDNTEPLLALDPPHAPALPGESLLIPDDILDAYSSPSTPPVRHLRCTSSTRPRTKQAHAAPSLVQLINKQLANGYAVCSRDRPGQRASASAECSARENDGIARTTEKRPGPHAWYAVNTPHGLRFVPLVYARNAAVHSVADDEDDGLATEHLLVHLLASLHHGCSGATAPPTSSPSSQHNHLVGSTLGLDDVSAVDIPPRAVPTHISAHLAPSWAAPQRLAAGTCLRIVQDATRHLRRAPCRKTKAPEASSLGQLSSRATTAFGAATLMRITQDSTPRPATRHEREEHASTGLARNVPGSTECPHVCRIPKERGRYVHPFANAHPGLGMVSTADSRSALLAWTAATLDDTDLSWDGLTDFDVPEAYDALGAEFGCMAISESLTLPHTQSGNAAAPLDAYEALELRT